MKRTPIDGSFPWERWESDAADVEQLDRRQAARLLFDTLAINRFEHALLELKNAGAVWGPVHTSVGQEATASAAVAALRPTDKMAATYRAHHQFLAKVLQAQVPADWDPAAGELPAEAQEVFYRTMAEIMGLAPGYCGGRGGSMHLRHNESGFLGSNAIVGGGVPLAAGAAYAEKFAGSGNVIVCYIGDGAVNQGAFHEACNLAGLWSLPLIVFVENNRYAVATRVQDACAVEPLSRRASAYAMDGYVVDGDDAIAILGLLREVAGRLRDGGTPAIIECECYRRYHHAGDVPGSAFRYRTREEEDRYAGTEVTRVLPRILVEAGLLDDAAVEAIDALAEQGVQAARAACTEEGDPPRVRESLWPDPGTAGDGMRSSGAELEGLRFVDRSPHDRASDDRPPDAGNGTALEPMRYSDAIAAVTGRWLEREADAIVFGEEVANLGGGAYGATKGLVERFPDRVINTPISEGGFSGLGFGAAMLGMRVVVEIMFADFALVAADQLFNQLSKARHMYGDTTDLPIVVRSRVGTGLGYGAQHSMDPVGLYGMFPGFRIVAPADAYDYIGLFNTAMHSLDPVVFLEHNALYTQRSPAPAGDLDYAIPFGTARTVQAGDQVTVLTYGGMVGRCAAVAAALADDGVSVELLDLRCLDRLSIDYDAIGASLAKTGAMVIVEEAARSQGIGPALAAEITTRCFDELDGPVACLTSLDISTPVSRRLELAALVSDEQIDQTVRAVADRSWR